MSWKNLKILAIVILIVMDSFFLFSLIKRTRSAWYYDAALIDSAISVFRESSFYVDRKFLSAKRRRFPFIPERWKKTFFLRFHRHFPRPAIR